MNWKEMIGNANGDWQNARKDEWELVGWYLELRLFISFSFFFTNRLQPSVPPDVLNGFSYLYSSLRSLTNIFNLFFKRKARDWNNFFLSFQNNLFFIKKQQQQRSRRNWENKGLLNILSLENSSVSSSSCFWTFFSNKRRFSPLTFPILSFSIYFM